MLKRILPVMMVCIICVCSTFCFAEENESTENTSSWLDKLFSSFSEPESDREPIYGSLEDKACTAAYLELEYILSDMLKDARTDIYSIYFIVACIAAQEIEDTLFDPDSSIYEKVGRTEYRLSLDYLFGENTDTESDSFKEGMKYIRKYFMQESASACGVFYDDLIEFGHMDEDGNMNLRTQKLADEIGISQDAVYAILEELNLYQTDPINGLKR